MLALSGTRAQEAGAMKKGPRSGPFRHPKDYIGVT